MQSHVWKLQNSYNKVKPSILEQFSRWISRTIHNSIIYTNQYTRLTQQSVSCQYYVNTANTLVINDYNLMNIQTSKKLYLIYRQHFIAELGQESKSYNVSLAQTVHIIIVRGQANKHWCVTCCLLRQRMLILSQ